MKSENELLAWLLPQLAQNENVVIPPGDDCAGLAVADGSIQLVASDALVEGVHYHGRDAAEPTPPELAARKLLCRNLSDIAAMGGSPVAALSVFGFPQDCPDPWREAFLRGLANSATEYGVPIIGGDLTTTPVVTASLTILGTVAADRVTTRAAANPGEVICVTGELGNSLASEHHLRFEPRLQEGRWLAARGVRAMIDLSDGLGADLPRLCQASGVSAQITSATLPLRAGATHQTAVTDGEDYELLFTISVDGWEELRHAWPFPCSLSKIGIIEAGPPAVRGIGDSPGFQHFTSPYEPVSYP